MLPPLLEGSLLFVDGIQSVVFSAIRTDSATVPITICFSLIVPSLPINCISELSDNSVIAMLFPQDLPLKSQDVGVMRRGGHIVPECGR